MKSFIKWVRSLFVCEHEWELLPSETRYFRKYRCKKCWWVKTEHFESWRDW